MINSQSRESGLYKNTQVGGVAEHGKGEQDYHLLVGSVVVSGRVNTWVQVPPPPFMKRDLIGDEGFKGKISSPIEKSLSSSPSILYCVVLPINSTRNREWCRGD